jgi:MFS family permease
LPRVLRLDRFVVSDEPLWLYRSANFYYALTHHDFASTYQKEHPGVTIMWAGTAGFLARYPGYRGSGLGQVESQEFEYYMNNFAKVSALDVLVAGRFFVVFGNVLALALSLLLARRMLGTLPALIGFLLVAFDPFHLSLSRILHPDAMLGSLMLLSLLAFMDYLHNQRLLSLLISGAAAGFAWLTKSPGFVLVPVIGILILYKAWSGLRIPMGGLWLKRLWSYAFPLILWGIAGILIFIAFWPALWVDPGRALSAIFSKAEHYAEEGHSAPVFFNGNIAEDGQLGLPYFYYYPLTYLWRSTPVVLVGLLLTAWGIIKRRKPFVQSETRLVIGGFLIMAIVFTIVMTLGAKKAPRYLIPIYAPLDICAGIGWAYLAYWFNERRFVSALSLFLVIGVQAALSLSTFPYYFTYYNPLMGGSRKVVEVLEIGWGEGLDQAARYLNQKSDASDLHVISWYSNGSFSYFFNGHTRFLGSETGNEEGSKSWDRFITSDYAVIYIHQWQRNTPEKILDYLSAKIPEYSVWINGIEYARVYKIR